MKPAMPTGKRLMRERQFKRFASNLAGGEDHSAEGESQR
jgi:hypothetical protein